MRTREQENKKSEKVEKVEKGKHRKEEKAEKGKRQSKVQVEVEYRHVITENTHVTLNVLT